MTMKRPSLFRVVYTVDTWTHEHRVPRVVRDVMCGLLDWSVGAPPIKPRWWKWERDVWSKRNVVDFDLTIDPDKIVITDHCRERMEYRESR